MIAPAKSHVAHSLPRTVIRSRTLSIPCPTAPLPLQYNEQRRATSLPAPILRADEATVQIAVAAPEERYEALRLICSRQSRQAEAQAENLLHLMSQGHLDPAGLWLATRNGRRVGAALSQPMAGRVAVLWPVQLVPQEPDDTALALLKASRRWWQRLDTQLVQCPIPPFDEDAVRRLTQAGFAHLADIQYLVATEFEPLQAPASHELAFVAAEGLQGRRALERIVQATYADSRDCPQLSGLRSMSDVLAGYEATGVHRPEWWQLVQYRQQTVGCLLLTDHPAEGQAELIYMGLVPACRGRGWSSAITQQALRLAQAAGRRQVVLAVDEANLAARHVYRRAGFRLWDRRQVWFLCCRSEQVTP